MGELATAMAQGLRSQNVAATAKHWAVYSVPKGGRDGHARTDPHVARRELEALHLLPWRKLIKEGAIQVRLPYLGLYLGPYRAPLLPLSNRQGAIQVHTHTRLQHVQRECVLGNSRPLPTPVCKCRAHGCNFMVTKRPTTAARLPAPWAAAGCALRVFR